MYKLLLKGMQFIKFGLVGLINTSVSLIIYYICIFMNLDPVISSGIGYILSSLVGYLINGKWVFKDGDIKSHRTIARYYLCYGTSFLLNLVSMYVLVSVMGVSSNIAPLVTMCITIPFNFVVNKFWVFKGER